MTAARALLADRWRSIAAAAERPTRSWVADEPLSAAGEPIRVVSPIDGTLIAEVEGSDAATVDAAVHAARRAFAHWRGMPIAERKALLLRFAACVDAARDELAALVTLETGKPIADAIGEVASTSAAIAFYAEAIDKVYGAVAPTQPDSLALITREPMGVIGMVTPWNYPLLMAAWKIAPALAAGNTAVLKPAEQAPLATLRLGPLAAQAGLPAGVLNVVAGVGEVAGAALGRHPDVDAIAFTGSSAVGKLFLTYAGESNMKAVSLECGGKSPNIIFEDVPDRALAARVTAEAIFSNAGEMCNAGARLLVQADLHDEFVECVSKEAQAWVPGDPFEQDTRMGALVDCDQLDRVTGYVERGVADGAQVAHGGRRARRETGGFYFEPTIIASVTNDMEIARDEVFGPVLCVIPFGEEDEAVRIANDTSFGLAAGVWSRDVRRVHRVARALRAGSVYVNCYDRGELSVPFGGHKQSGLDVDKSLLALEKYTRVKSTWIGLE